MALTCAIVALTLMGGLLGCQSSAGDGASSRSDGSLAIAGCPPDRGEVYFPPYRTTWWAYAEWIDDEGGLVVSEVVVDADGSLMPGERLEFPDPQVFRELLDDGGRVLVGATADRVSFRVGVDPLGDVTIFDVPGCGVLTAGRFHAYLDSAVSTGTYPDEVSVLLDIVSSVPGTGGWLPYQEALGFDPSQYPWSSEAGP